MFRLLLTVKILHHGLFYITNIISLSFRSLLWENLLSWFSVEEYLLVLLLAIHLLAKGISRLSMSKRRSS